MFDFGLGFVVLNTNGTVILSIEVSGILGKSGWCYSDVLVQCKTV